VQFFEILGVFAGSLGIGAGFGLISAVISKHAILEKNSSLQIALILILSYSSYLLADGVSMSGIASILACGVVMGHYTYNNLSEKAKKLSKNILRVLGNFAEMFVFVYLGIALVSFDTSYRDSFDISLIGVSIPITFIARMFNIFPLTMCINATRTEKRKIKCNDQILMWYGGLRGAMAFALSLEVPSVNQKHIFITTTVIVLFSILILGGLAIPIINCLEIKVGKEAQEFTNRENPDSKLYSNNSFFIKFDRKYLKPLFTKYDKKLKDKAKEEEEEKQIQQQKELEEAVEQTNIRVEEKVL